MKKRIISIFLIVSVIASLFAISSVSTSAYSSYASAPTLTSVVPYKGYVNVNWKHNGYATTAYCVWVHKWGTPSSNWSKYYSVSNKYKNIKLDPNCKYDIKVSAKDEMGRHSKYSKCVVVSTKFPQTPCFKVSRYPGTQIGQDFAILSFGTMNYSNNSYFNPSYVSYYRLAVWENGKVSYLQVRGNSYAHYFKSNQTPTYQIQSVCSLGGKEYRSNWSSAITAKY